MLNAKYRLQNYRAQAAKRTEQSRVNSVYTWRDIAKYSNPLIVRDYLTRREGKMFADSLDGLPGQIVANDKDSRDRNACGWYVDHFQYDCMYGAVLRVHSSRGTFYYPVTFCTAWDGVTAYLNDPEMVDKGADEYEHEKAQNEALRSARHYAEREAEESREFHAKDQAEQQIYEAREAIHELNKTALPLFAELRKGVTYAAPICEAIRARIAAIIEERSEQFKIIAERENNFWSAVEY